MEHFLNILKKFIDFLNYLKIIASPLFISAFIGIIVYSIKTDFWGMIIGILITLTGILLGVILAQHAKKTVGSTDFMARSFTSFDINDALEHDLKSNS